MKKILLIMAASFIIFAALPFSAFAYQGGLLDGKPLKVGTHIDNVTTTTTTLTDGNTNTKYSLGERGTADTVYYTFETLHKIESFYIVTAASVTYFRMYGENGELLYSAGLASSNTGKMVTLPTPIENVKTVAIVNERIYNGDIWEFNVYGKDTEIFAYPITNLKESHTYEAVNLSWTNPVHPEFTALKIRRDGVEVATLEKTKTSYSISGLEAEKNYNFDVIATYSNGSDSIPQSINVTTDKIPPIGEVENFSATATEHNKVNLSWKLPETDLLKHVNIYKNGTKIGETSGSSYIDLTVEPETNYTYKITTTSMLGAESEGITKEVTTPPIGEVENFSATATEHNKVNLAWKLPETDFIKHVNIYKNGMKIGETGGSSYIDLTVEPETNYTYKITITSMLGAESEGIIKQVTTPKVPLPKIVGGGYEKDPLTGNFIYYWDEPTTGQVKVFVGGSEYKIVDSAAKQISIPKNEMKYTAFGDPDVSLIPISTDGKEGAAVKPPLNGEGSADSIENVKVPFSANDLLGSGVGLLWFIAPILLLVLAFLVVPKLRRMLFSIFTKNSTEEGTRRFNDETSPGRENETKEQRQQREKREYRERKDKAEREKREQRERKERAERAQRAATGKEAIIKIEKAPKVAKEPRARREKVGRSERQQRQQRERSTRERTTRAERG